MEQLSLRNKYSDIQVGAKIFSSVENQSQWYGGNEGVLDHDGSDFVIRTPKGIVAINKGYDAYINTIRPI